VCALGAHISAVHLQNHVNEATAVVANPAHFRRAWGIWGTGVAAIADNVPMTALVGDLNRHRLAVQLQLAPLLAVEVPLKVVLDAQVTKPDVPHTGANDIVPVDAVVRHQCGGVGELDPRRAPVGADLDADEDVANSFCACLELVM